MNTQNPKFKGNFDKILQAEDNARESLENAYKEK